MLDYVVVLFVVAVELLWSWLFVVVLLSQLEFIVVVVELVGILLLLLL